MLTVYRYTQTDGRTDDLRYQYRALQHVHRAVNGKANVQRRILRGPQGRNKNVKQCYYILR